MRVCVCVFYRDAGLFLRSFGFFYRNAGLFYKNIWYFSFAVSLSGAK